MTVLVNTASRVFYPHEVSALSAAYRHSCESLRRSHDVRLRGRQAHYAQETIAKLIIGYASAGERDPDVLAQSALREMNAL